MITMGGAGYFLKGLKLLWQPGIPAFVVIPLLINILLFAVLTTVLVSQFDALFTWLAAQLPSWLQWLLWLLWVIVGAVWLLIYGYSFAIISNLIAAPFYGLLAEQVELHLRGQVQSEALTFSSLLALTGRTLVREVQKLLYFLPRLLLVVLVSLILYFIPGIGLLVPGLYFLWGAWSLALQNTDFAADNNKLSFPDLRRRCAQRRGLSLSFGAVAVLASSVPLFNLLAVPAAVAGATALWVDRLASDVAPTD